MCSIIGDRRAIRQLRQGSLRTLSQFFSMEIPTGQETTIDQLTLPHSLNHSSDVNPALLPLTYIYITLNVEHRLIKSR
jgi:hypothetical protein